MKVGLEALELLKARRYRRGNHPEAYMATFLHEKSAAEEKEWLRSAASQDDCTAMERLAQRLLAEGNSIPSQEEAFRWLWRAAGQESISACYTLAVRLLDAETGADPAEGGRLLHRAANSGFLPAIRELGIRILNGMDFPQDPAEGRRLLTRAADAGDRASMILLGRYLQTGRCTTLHCNEGARWLAQAGALASSGQNSLAMALYSCSLRATTQVIRKRFVLEAAFLLLEGFQQGELMAGINLAYLVRRSELGPEAYPTLADLLHTGLSEENPFAIVNQSLRLAAGIACDQDWRSADQLFSSLHGSFEIFDWWMSLVRAGDPEGHVVIGWLVRHGLTADPDGLSCAQRFEGAKSWLIPEWMAN
jgi:hypothetical protein